MDIWIANSSSQTQIIPADMRIAEMTDIEDGVEIALAIAFSGIIVTLLDGGQTTFCIQAEIRHSNKKPDAMCTIEKKRIGYGITMEFNHNQTSVPYPINIHTHSRLFT
ncbi:hypothetical protein TNCV_1139271 [Trichonephila clavipes]|nr:hypothetical protein TNCV_1139271 [Trichonephila clavipes]